ncbi:MAG: diguanylate cyclase [Deltaproteobacteria bacterium]|nr:diguanylate cyclase [Deltaproteobacteria bacterium]
MKDPSRTNQQLIDENALLKQRIRELEQAESERKQTEKVLRESEEKYHVLFEGINDAVFVHDLEGDTLSGRFLQVNDMACRRLGYTREELLSLTPREITTSEEYERIAKKRIDLASQGDILAETIHVAKDGRKISVESNIRKFQYFGKQVALSISRDITDRKQAGAYREMGREVLQILNEPGDLQARIQRVLAKLKTHTGFDAVGIRLQDGDDFPYLAQEGFPKDFLQTENTLIERAADGEVCRDKDGKVSLECTCGLIISGKTDPTHPLFTAGGSCWTNDSFPLLDIPPGEDPRLHPRNQCIHQGYASVALVPIRNQDRIVGLIQFNDRRKGCFTLDTVELLEGIASHIGAALMRMRVEEALRASEERYRELSIVDDLTQLYNSRHFHFQLKIEMDRSNRYEQPLTLLLLDLDNFKAFNDAYGHVEGDQVLIRLGQVVKRCLRQTDSAYRYGGEEFTILLPMATSEDGAVTAERIRTEFKKENFSPAPGRDVHVTVSIGLAQYKPEEDMKAFVNRVDHLMYQAKKNGKDRVCPESY